MAESNGKMPEEPTKHFVSARQKRGRKKPKLQPPLTPMIDVTFQLLIFFVLTGQFRTEGQIPASLPPLGAGEPQVVEFKPVRVRLVPSGAFGQDAVFEVTGANYRFESHEELFRFFQQKRQQFPRARKREDDLPIVIAPTARVRWRHVVEAFNQAVRAKFVNIGFAPLSG
jgi:biopolymer transport protein ExbD